MQASSVEKRGNLDAKVVLCLFFWKGSCVHGGGGRQV
jgi:hypothetical protein